MNVLLIGRGVIGSVYAAQFALAGHNLWVLGHGSKNSALLKQGILIKDVELGKIETAPAEITTSTSLREYNLVLVAVRADQLESTFSALRALSGKPDILFLGNNPEGYNAIPRELIHRTLLGFPGISGTFNNGVVEYIHVDQQPTVLERSNSHINRVIGDVLTDRGFKVANTSNIDGWLKYHAVFISCISMALLREGVNATKLGNNRTLLRLMCKAIEEGFHALKSHGTKGAPANLTFLHIPILRPIAILYWSNLFRSSKGELYFGAHVRHAEAEVLSLASWVNQFTGNTNGLNNHLHSLLTPTKV